MTEPATIRLMIFRNDEAEARGDLRAGIDSFVVDWEQDGKEERQRGWDTDIRPGTARDLAAIAAIPGAEAWCRVNGPGSSTAEEVERAVAAGARGIFLPMVRHPGEVESFLRRVDGRAGAAILVETLEAFACAHDLARLPLDRVYFGLNDFAISRGSASIFEALLDGSIEAMRGVFRDVDFGFGGLTDVESGFPVPCRRLLEEMARLDIRFTFLRRSYFRDSAGRDATGIVRGIREKWSRCVSRSGAEIERDHRALEEILRDVCRGAEVPR